MELPFSVDQFLGVFRAYNLAIWPAQILLYLLGVALVLLAVRRAGRWPIAGGLALLWAWTGAAYHLAFFSEVNPAARLFGAVFLVQAGVWLIWAWRVPTLTFQAVSRNLRVVGGALVAYAFLVYPLLNVVLGHRYPMMPTFGAPCPTTIATLGLLTWAAPRPPWFVWVVPILWALIGTSAAFTLGIHEDLGLLAAAAAALAVHFVSRRAATTA
jgi:hypothetical protein